MATMLETPSRIWRRIEAVQDKEMPSLPSLPSFDDDSAEEGATPSRVIPDSDLDDDGLDTSFDAYGSLKNSGGGATSKSTIRPALNNSHTGRFSNSIGARSAKSSVGPTTLRRKKDSFDITDIPSLSNVSKGQIPLSDTEDELEQRRDHHRSRASIPEVYNPSDDDEDVPGEDSILDALESVSRVSSPPPLPKSATPKKTYDYSVSLKSEPKASPFDKYRNVGLRKPTGAAARARTPSLTRTTDSSSTNSSPAASTPRSTRSPNMRLRDAGTPLSAARIALPRSVTASPASPAQRTPIRQEVQRNAHDDADESRDSLGTSMDITDVHISPQRIDEETPSYDQPEEQEPSEPQNSEADDQREPTFSSDSEPLSYVNSNRTIVPPRLQSPAHASNAASSPGGPSIAMTPTPAFPRARARFDLPPPPSDLLQTPAPRDFAEREDFTTPATRRKSFLLQVVNSNVRPRMKMGTPHPHRFVPATPSIAESTPRAGVQEAVEETPSSNSSHASSNAAPALRAAFVGLTPRPRAQITARRLSHPLAQGFSANSPQTSDSESATARPVARKPWGTPMINSPYDGANDKASFVSTASSHDLTTHQRVNTSFDPAMGFGAVANVNRFNAGKLNNYLHSLNHKLQEENESLLARLRQMEEERASSSLREEGSPQPNTSRRQSGQHRRISMAGGLDNVLEDNAEAWMEEKADLEDRIEQYLAEKEELEKELEKEKEGRTKDQARFEQRTKETQREALNVLTDIEKDAAAAHQRAQEAEERLAQQTKESEREMEKLKDELDAAYERAGKTERLLENGKDLGGALSEANERIAQIMGDLRNANAQIQGLEDEVAQADHKMHDLEVELKEEKEAALALEQALAAEQERTQELQQSIDVLEQELVSAKEYTDELEEGVGAQVEALEKELEQAKASVETLTMAEENSARTIKDLEDGLERQKNLTVQLEEALEEAKNKMSEDDDTISELNSKISSLERERDRWKQLADNPREPSLRLDGGPTEEEMELMERELSVAQKEIARLSTMLAQSPARKAIDKAKEAKIEMLEREKEELLERNKALRMTMNEVQTPGKVVNGSMMSPIHRLVLNNSIRYPKTPGGPLRDMSWLNSTQHDPTMAPLIAEIQRLQHELDEANESIDDKLDKLEDAGLGVVGLTKKLEDARARISQLEDELARNARKEERTVRRLARARCKECNVKLDLHGLTGDESHDFSWTSVSEEDPSPRGRGSELKAQLHAANASLENLRQEMEELQADNKRLGGQVRNAKAEVKKVAEGRRSSDNMQMELERAKETIATLEDALATERSKLRSLTVEQQIVEREKKHCLQDLERTELDMENIREQLQKLKRQNDDLEKELRQNSTAEQKARLLESKVSANMETISQLRQERSLLSSDHKDLQRRYSELSETVSRLKEEHAAHSTSHDQHRHKLDLQALEIEELKQALDDRSSQLHRVERELEKERQALDKPDMSKTIATLEADLRRVRRDAEAFGRDLKTLRAEKDKLEAKLKDELTKGERAKKQSNTQVKLLNEQVETQKRKLAKALEEFESHACGSDESQVSTLKIQHHKECKGLLVQIKYLKAKFLRESSFREDLSYQKNYLLVLLSKFEKSEKTIFASIARIGFPVAPAKNRRTRKLKSLAMMIMFLNRVKKGCSVWKEHTATKAAVTAALDDVRKRRALTTS